MNCPKCMSAMEKVNFKGIIIDRCTNCRGIWFDMLEHKDLKGLEGSETIDIGDPKIGKKYNKIEKIKCPKCTSRMIPMVDAKQKHLWYESCPVCYGVFFDAGEFIDYKEENILDYIKDLLTGERK